MQALVLSASLTGQEKQDIMWESDSHFDAYFEGLCISPVLQKAASIFIHWAMLSWVPELAVTYKPCKGIVTMLLSSRKCCNSCSLHFSLNLYFELQYFNLWTVENFSPNDLAYWPFHMTNHISLFAKQSFH